VSAVVRAHPVEEADLDPIRCRCPLRRRLLDRTELVERGEGRHEPDDPDELAAAAEDDAAVAERRLSELRQDDRVQGAVTNVAVRGRIGLARFQDRAHGRDIAVDEGTDHEALGLERRHLHRLGGHHGI
jgi:hypothetical protein